MGETRCFYSILKLHRCAEIQNKPWHTDTTITGIEKYHNKITKNQWGVGTSEGTHQSHEVSINYQNDNWYFSKTASKQRQIGLIGSWLKDSDVKIEIVNLGNQGFRIILEIPNKTSNILAGRCNRLIIHTKRILGIEKLVNTESESGCLVKIYGNKDLFSEETNETCHKLKYDEERKFTKIFMTEKKK